MENTKEEKPKEKKRTLEDTLAGSGKYIDEFNNDVRHYGAYLLLLIIFIGSLAYLTYPLEKPSDELKISDAESRLVESLVGKGYEVIKPVQPQKNITDSWPFIIAIFAAVGFILASIVYFHHRHHYNLLYLQQKKKNKRKKR